MSVHGPIVSEVDLAVSSSNMKSLSERLPAPASICRCARLLFLSRYSYSYIQKQDSVASTMLVPKLGLVPPPIDSYNLSPTMASFSSSPESFDNGHWDPFEDDIPSEQETPQADQLGFCQLSD